MGEICPSGGYPQKKRHAYTVAESWRAPQFADALASPARPGIGSTVLSATNAVGGNRATSTLRVPRTATLSCELR
jgi:hypothetical protein